MKLTLGIVPLTDCAVLVAAQAKGFFSQLGLEVTLSAEPSWANIRDKVAVGALDGAQMLATMPLTTTLGLAGTPVATITAMGLGLNGNAITVSRSLHERMVAALAEFAEDPALAGPALRRVIEADRRERRRRLILASVFPTATHTYLLRYWLAAAGIDPVRDVQLVVVPPQRMAGHLQDGRIDGYCVGEPWNSVSVAAGIGRAIVTSYEIWNNHPEKVFGVAESWAEAHPEAHQALLQALLQAARWADAPEHREELAGLIARDIDVPLPIVQASLTGTFRYAADRQVAMPDFHVFYRYAATFPWRSHARWFLAQMSHWRELGAGLDVDALARRVYRADLYRAAAGALGWRCPAVDHKPEGTHAEAWSPEPGGLVLGADRFIDAGRFGDN